FSSVYFCLVFASIPAVMVRPYFLSQHTAIVDAITARDPARAGEAMRQHLLTLQERLIRITSLDHSETEVDKTLA
ncbi:FCD domain-containing protein, partial [Rhizobium ruizarguesonis]